MLFIHKQYWEQVKLQPYNTVLKSKVGSLSAIKDIYHSLETSTLMLDVKLHYGSSWLNSSYGWYDITV